MSPETQEPETQKVAAQSAAQAEIAALKAALAAAKERMAHAAEMAALRKEIAETNAAAEAAANPPPTPTQMKRGNRRGTGGTPLHVHAMASKMLAGKLGECGEFLTHRPGTILYEIDMALLACACAEIEVDLLTLCRKHVAQACREHGVSYDGKTLKGNYITRLINAGVVAHSTTGTVRSEKAGQGATLWLTEKAITYAEKQGFLKLDESQPTESQPTESQPTESQPTESQPTESPANSLPSC